MIMVNQYKKETSQIHAPADLIRRTKEAVREEEQRIAREQMKQVTAAQPKHSYAKVYKWALPVAAAVCLFLLNAGVVRLGRGMSGSGMSQSQSDASMSGASESNNMKPQTEDLEMHEKLEDAAIDESIDQGGAFDTTAETTTTAEEPVSAGGSSYDMTEEVATEEEYESEGYEGGQRVDMAASALRIEEFEEVPSIYGDSEMEPVIAHDLKFYVWQDQDKHWIAYVCLNDKVYIISGELTEEIISREEFVERAYELLMEAI